MNLETKPVISKYSGRRRLVLDEELIYKHEKLVAVYDYQENFWRLMTKEAFSNMYAYEEESDDRGIQE